LSRNLTDKIVKERDGSERVGELAASSSVISQYAPELEPGDRVLDSRTSTSMTAPGDVHPST
jgi:hypothetical protein